MSTSCSTKYLTEENPFLFSRSIPGKSFSLLQTRNELKMIVSFGNAIICPKQQLSMLRTAACPVLCYSKNYSEVVRCWRRGTGCNIRCINGLSKGRVCSVSNHEGLWEDPDDGSDDEDYADADAESEELEENDLDYESDWEDGKKDKVVVISEEELAKRRQEEDFIKEIEQLLTPEERAILEQNEAPNLEKISTGKWTLIHTFAQAGQIKFMDGLMERGYDIEHTNKDGLTALHQAVIGKREAVISHLLRKGANPGARDLDGATPLHYAAQVGALQTVKLLVIKYKVDVNVADNEGWTPLHVAVQARNREIAKLLLVNGADKTMMNKNGKTALDLSFCYGKEFKSYDLAKLLKQVPADRGYF